MWNRFARCDAGGGVVCVRGIAQHVRVLAAVVIIGVGVLACPAEARHRSGHGPPQIAFDSITDVTTSGATFNARANSGFEGVIEYVFDYCPTLECPHGTVSTEPVLMRVDPEDEDGDPLVAFSQRVEGLRHDTTYTVTLRVGNDTWSLESGDESKTTMQFSTRPLAVITEPSAATLAASGVTPTTATLNASVVAGTTGSPDAATAVWFEWRAGNGPTTATARQSLLPSGTAVPVSASLIGLTPNADHSFRVVAERNGRQVAGGFQGFRTAAAPCPPGSTRETVRVGRIHAAGCFRSAGRRWVSEQPVLLNGLQFRPTGGTTPAGHRFVDCSSSECQALQQYLDSGGSKLYIDADGDAIGTRGNWEFGAGSLKVLHSGSPDFKGVDWNGARPLMSLGPSASLNLYGFRLAGKFTFWPKADGGGQLSLLTAMPVVLGGVTGESNVGVTPGGELVLDGLRIDVAEANIGMFPLGGLSFVYDRANDLWRGAAKFTVPMPGKINVGVSTTVRGGRFHELSGEVDNLNRHVAKGVFMQRIGVLAGLDPVRIGGSIGLSAGPVVRVLKVRAMGVDGTFLFKDAYSTFDRATRIQTNYPPSFVLSGTFSLVDIPLTEVGATFYFTYFPWIDFSAKQGYEIVADVDGREFVIARLQARLNGGVHDTRFYASGSAEGTILGYTLGQAFSVVSTRGIAACGVAFETFKIGVYRRWDQRHGTIFYECSMRKLQSEVGVSAAHAGAGTRVKSASAVSPVGSVRLDDDPQGMIRFVGETAPPEVRLRARGGRTIDMPAAGRAIGGNSRHMVIRDASTRSTAVLIDRPAGRWRYELLPGSSPVRRIETAGSLPAPRVRATVRRRGDAAVLRWNLRRVAGQRVTFVERAPGVPPRVIAETTARRGSKRFRPFRLGTRARRIVAIVQQGGFTRSERVVARYRAPGLRKLRRPARVKARLKRGVLTASWRRVPGAFRYDVIVIRDTGARRLLRTRRPRLVPTRAAAAGARQLRVRAVGLDGRPGPSRTVRVRR